MGPGNPSTTVPHQYSFVVFEQAAEVTLASDSEYRTSLTSRANFNLTDLVNQLELGPIRGINWAWTLNDAFANVELMAFGVLTELPCPTPIGLGLVAEHAANNDFGFLDPGDLDSLMNLSTILNVSYTQPAGTLDYCGETLSLDGADFSLVPTAEMGLPPNRVTVSANTSPSARGNEVHIYLR